METAPTYWNYDSRTFALTGSGIADRSPADEDEVWLFPAHSTQTPPPSNIPSGKAAVYDVEGDAWNLVTDLRGRIYYTATGTGTMVELGELPEGVALSPPPEVISNQKTVLEDGEWKVVWDYRGQIWWKSHDEWVRIEELGDPLEKGLTPMQPQRPNTPPTSQDPEGSISKRQATRAMIIGAKITNPDAYITNALGSIQDEEERALAIQDWMYAPYFMRDHAMFNDEAVLAAAQFTPELVDQLWTLALSQPR